MREIKLFVDFNNELWKDIVGYEGLYQVSSFGRVKSIERHFIDTIGRNQVVKEKIKKHQVSNCGYLRIELFDKSHKAKKYGVHVLVAKAFIPNPENKPEVNHKDGIKSNCYDWNLEWVTPSENQIHAFNTGLQKRIKGEDNYNAKLTKVDVASIKNEYKGGKISQAALGCKYFVSQAHINRIVNKKRSWIEV